MKLHTYLESVSEEVKQSRKSRESKVEKAIYDKATELISEGKASTVKAIAEALDKSTQQIHQTVRKASLVKKVKLNGRSLIVPAEME